MKKEIDLLRTIIMILHCLKIHQEKIRVSKIYDVTILSLAVRIPMLNAAFFKRQ